RSGNIREVVDCKGINGAWCLRAGGERDGATVRGERGGKDGQATAQGVVLFFRGGSALENFGKLQNQTVRAFARRSDKFGGIEIGNDGQCGRRGGHFSGD